MPHCEPYTHLSLIAFPPTTLFFSFPVFQSRHSVMVQELLTLLPSPTRAVPLTCMTHMPQFGILRLWAAPFPTFLTFGLLMFVQECMFWAVPIETMFPYLCTPQISLWCLSPWIKAWFHIKSLHCIFLLQNFTGVISPRVEYCWTTDLVIIGFNLTTDPQDTERLLSMAHWHILAV